MQQRRKAFVKLSESTLRKPTLQWILLIDRVFRICRDVGLELFENAHLLKDVGILPMISTGTKVATDVFARFLSLPLPGSLWIAADQEQRQITACNFLADHCGLTIEFIFDFAHRSTNDMVDTLVKCGLWTIYLMAIVIFNISFGPYGSCAWFQQLVHTAQKMRNALTPNDPLVLRYWPRILVERGHHYSTDQAKVGEQARQELIDNMDVNGIVSRKGQRCSKKQWWSFNRTFRAWKTTMSERALLYSGCTFFVLCPDRWKPIVFTIS
jgi:hypothetical protein